MATPKNNLTTGQSQLNAQLMAGAVNLAQPAAQLASGASAMQVATSLLKDAFMQKLLGPAAAFTGVLSGTLLVIRKIVRESQILEKGLVKISQLQQIEGKFETLLKSSMLAKKRIQELYEFTARSPFRFEDVAEANRVLEALTYGAFSGKKAMEMVGDAAAATGQGMGEMAERVGKLYAALSSGRSIDKIAFQLQYTGLATDGLLGKLERLEQAGASFNEMWGEVEKVMSRTAGGMENEMQTLEALGTKLEEARSEMQKAFAEPFIEAQSNSIKTMTDATRNLTPVVRAIGEDIALVKGLFVDFKNSIIDVTLAAPGMATALGVAWGILKGILATISVITFASFIRGASAMVAYANSVRAAAASQMASALAARINARATDALTQAQVRAAVASRALALGHAQAGAVAAGQSIKELALSAALRMQGAAMAIHAGGMQAINLARSAGTKMSALSVASNYAMGTSITAAGKAYSLAATGVKFLWTTVSGAVAALGFMGVTVAGVVAALGSFFLILREASKVGKEFDALSKSIGETTSKLQDLLNAATNTDDWAKYMQNVTEEIGKASIAIDELKKKASERGVISNFIGSLTGRNIREKGAIKEAENARNMLKAQRAASIKKLPFLGMGSKESEAYASELQTREAMRGAALDNALGNADAAMRVKLLEQEADRLDTLARSSKNARDAQVMFDRDPKRRLADAALSDAKQSTDLAEQQLKDVGLKPEDFKNRLNQKTDVAAIDRQISAIETKRSEARAAAAAAMEYAGYTEFGSGVGMVSTFDEEGAQKQIDALNEAKAAAQETAAAEAAVLEIRKNSSSQLVTNNVEIDKLKSSGTKLTDQEVARLAELEKQNIEIVQQIQNADEYAKNLQRTQQEIKKAKDELAISNISAGFDPEIAQATAAGDDALVSELRYKQQIAVIDEKIVQAQRDKNEAEVKSLQNQKALIAAERKRERDNFKIERAVDRAANKATIRGDKEGAQAIRDANDLRKLREEYRSMGMDPAQATKDWSNSILAEAASQRPGVVASSLQSIGGGGGFSAGGDPIRAAQERIARATEQFAPKIDKLIETIRGPAGG